MVNTATHELTSARKSVRIWYGICLIAWILLIPLSAWLGTKDEFGWKALASPVNALTSAFGAVVLGAILFRRWQERVELEQRLRERHEWLDRNLLYALRSQEAMCETLSNLASEAYGGIADTFEDNRVPDASLRRDITRQPQALQALTAQDRLAGLVRQITDWEALTETGPLGTAAEQVSRLYRGLVSAEVAQARQTRERLTGEIDDSPLVQVSGEPSVEAQDIATHAFTHEVLERINLLAERTLDLTPDMIGPGEFEPRDLRGPGIELTMAAQHLTDALLWHHPQADGGQVLRAVERILRAISELRYNLWRNAESLAQEAEAVGGMPALHAALERFSETSAFDDYLWANWRRDHGLDTESAL